MNNRLSTFALVASLACIPACGEFQTDPDTAAEVVIDYAVVTANAAALGIETAQHTAQATYYVTQRQMISQSVQERWPQEKHDTRFARLREQWKPVWAGFKKARASHALLVKAIDAGEGVAAAVLVLSTARKDLAAAMAAPDNFLGQIVNKP